MCNAPHPFADQLRRDFDYEREHWDEIVDSWCTDWTKYTEFIADVFGTSPGSRKTGGGKAPDGALRSLLRTLPIDQRLALEWNYKLWVGSAYDELPTRPVLAFALRITEEELDRLLGTAVAALRSRRDEFLRDLAEAQVRRRP